MSMSASRFAGRTFGCGGFWSMTKSQRPWTRMLRATSPSAYDSPANVVGAGSTASTMKPMTSASTKIPASQTRGRDGPCTRPVCQMAWSRPSTLVAVHAGAEGPAPLAVGVIGCGYWGPNLVRNCNENEATRVVAVADLREDRLRAIERKAPGARLTTSHAELLADPEVEAVVVTTPVSTHFELGRAALEAGKHVVMAKPLAANVSECERLIALAAERDRVLLVDHTFVYTGAVRKIRDLLDEGALGEIYYFDSVRVNLG